MKLHEVSEEIIDLTEAFGAMRKIGGFISKHPIVAAGAAAMALAKYNKNKRYTARLFAKTQEEKKLYRAIINDLMRTGQYKKVREKYVDGGIMWELKRRNV